MHIALTSLGHDVTSAVEIDPKATDEEVLTLALEEQRILITEDRDFGELVFVQTGCLIRFVDMRVTEKVAGDGRGD